MHRFIFVFRIALILMILLGFVPDSSLAQNLVRGTNQEISPAPSSNQETTTHTLYLPTISQPPSIHPVFGVEMSSVSQGTLLDMASRAGIKWVRRNGVLWNEIEAVEGVRDWSSMANLESEMTILNQRGMELVLIIRGVPEWARTDGGHICGPIAQDKFGAFANFMYELVSRYSQPPYNVRYWELGNEPDSEFISNTSPFGCWGDSGNRYYGGGRYGKMLKAVYPEIKAADPDAHVLVGGLLMDCDPNNPPPGRTCTMSKFLEGILQEGAGNFFDGVSFHSYDYYGFLGAYSNPNWNAAYNTTGPAIQIKANFLYSVLERYGFHDKYLMATETALLCSISCGDDYETTKAIYATQNYALSLITRLRSSIWYSYTNPWRSTYLIQSSIPKPAYYALQTVSEKLSNSAFRQKITISGLSVYEFTVNGDRIWIAWSLDGLDHAINLPVPPVRMWDMFGNPISINNETVIGMQPVYLEWND